MAAHIFYTCLINNDQYILIGRSGDKLISPEQLGMQLPELYDDCHQSFYWAMYELIKEALFLRGISTISGNENFISIGESEPVKDFYKTAYCSLDVAIPFTGKIRLAKGFIDEPYINMSYQKAMAYKKVFDLTLVEGQMVKVKNRSLEMEQKRDALKGCYESSKSANIREYYKSLNRLEKILYASGFDIDLQ
jgi:hypothetical protein